MSEQSHPPDDIEASNLAQESNEHQLIAFEAEKPEICLICELELNEVTRCIIPDCFDKFCFSCVTIYITLKVQDNQVINMPCPLHTCKAEISTDVIQAVLSPELYEKYKKFKANEVLNRNPNLR